MAIHLGGDPKEAFGAIAKAIRESMLDPVKLTVLATELERFSKPARVVEKQATEEDTPKAAPPETEKKAAPEEPAPKKSTKKATQDEAKSKE